MLSDLHPIYVYRTHLDDGLNVVQMAYKVDGEELSSTVTPDEAWAAGFGHMTCLPLLVMQDFGFIVDTVIDELENEDGPIRL